MSAGAAGGLTSLTLDLYTYIIEQLPPTPSRFHYIFNLRDLSRVTEGLLLASPTCFTTAAQFVRLWRNEVLRVFHDRLISPEDKQASACTCSVTPWLTSVHCLHILLCFTLNLYAVHEQIYSVLIPGLLLQTVQERVSMLVQQKYMQHSEAVLTNPILFGDYRSAKKVCCGFGHNV